MFYQTLPQLPSHKEEYAELKAECSKSYKTLSLFQKLLYELQLHCHGEDAHMPAPNPPFNRMIQIS